MFGLGIVVVHAWKNSGFPWVISLVPRVVHWWVGSAVLSAIYSYVHVYLMIQYLLIQTTCQGYLYFYSASKFGI